MLSIRCRRMGSSKNPISRHGHGTRSAREQQLRQTWARITRARTGPVNLNKARHRALLEDGAKPSDSCGRSWQAHLTRDLSAAPGLEAPAAR